MPATDISSRYESLKYPIEIIEDEDAYVASVPDLPGCVAYGDTLQEALESLKSVKKLWIDGRLEAGLPVPEPTELDEYSGKFVLRISRGLHKALQRESKRQGLSLNQYVAQILAERHQLFDLGRVVEEAVSKCLPASPFTSALARWNLGPDWHSMYEMEGGVPLSVERIGQNVAALFGNKQTKTLHVRLEERDSVDSCWTSYAPKKTKAHSHC